MEKNLIIVRGVPGCGKSTLAKILSEGNKFPVCTADDYFMKNGEYKFDISKLGSAHKSCKDKCEKNMKTNVEKIFVANTSTMEKELTDYFMLAEKYGYKVFSIIVENRHGGKNSHGVPDDKILTMKNRFSIKL